MNIIDKREIVVDTTFKSVRVGQVFCFRNSQKEILLKTGQTQYFNFTKNYTHVEHFEFLGDKKVNLLETELHIIKDI